MGICNFKDGCSKLMQITHRNMRRVRREQIAHNFAPKNTQMRTNFANIARIMAQNMQKTVKNRTNFANIRAN